MSRTQSSLLQEIKKTPNSQAIFFAAEQLLSQVSPFFSTSVLLGPHTLNEQFPVGHWIMTEWYSGEDGSWASMHPRQRGGLLNRLFLLRYSKIRSLKHVAATRFTGAKQHRARSAVRMRYRVPKTRVSVTSKLLPLSLAIHQTVTAFKIDNAWMGCSKWFILPAVRAKQHETIQVLKLSSFIFFIHFIYLSF